MNMNAMTGNFPGSEWFSGVLKQQKRMYEGGFYSSNRWRWAFRDDCWYRRRRLFEVLAQLGFAAERKRIFELGFGTGDLLFQFPTSCKLMGVELSREAVEAVDADPRMAHYASRWFRTVNSDGSIPAPDEPVDLVLASHVLEHVPDDREVVRQLVPMLERDGLLVVFVPIEEPGFDPKHVRTYTVASLRSMLRGEGLRIVHAEAHYQICSGPFRWLDHPARHEWPLLKGLEGLRNLAMTAMPYHAVRGLEELLQQTGVKGKQAMVVARR